MIFYRLDASKMGDDPAQAYSELLDSLVAQYTNHVFEGFMPCEVVIRKDNVDYTLDDEIMRYADTDIIIYSLEEKIDSDYFHIAMRFSTPEGHLQVTNIMRALEAHPAFDERVRNLRIVGVISDDPQCLPCIKRRKERAERQGKLLSLSEVFKNKGGEKA